VAVTNSATGRYGNATVGGNVVNITKWTGKLHKEFAKSTDSGNLDATGTPQLWQSRKPGEVWIEGTIEGYYDFGGSTDTNFTANFKIDGPFATVLKLNSTVTWASFNADFDDFNLEVTVPGATTIGFTTNFQSNGICTLP